ncbi:MAG: sigma-70 family RNA polymerase sigma factor [Planctomycetes bacterium]|nr:sigma-70 family RNA polymerase sigma factor [Planctomycetota bacterium]
MNISPDLVLLAKTGDRRALASLVAATQDPLFHFLNRELGSAADAEDALQETWRQAIRSLPGLRDPASFRGWIHRIAIRAAGDLALARRARHRVEENASRNEPVEDSAMAGAERQETAERVRAAVASLEPNLRTAVRLRYEQGLSYEEIAAATESQSGTVGKRLHTAHERLREALAGVGVVVALAVLERELGAAERVAAPESAKRQLAQLVRGRSAATPTAGRKRGAAVAAIAALLLIGIAFVWKQGAGRGAEKDARPGAERVSGVNTPRSEGAGSAPVVAGEVASATRKPPPAELAAAPAETGRVTGVVRDVSSGAPIAGARVQLRPIGTPEGRKPVYGATDDHGAFVLDAAPGAYFIDAWSDDYPAFSVRDFVEDIVVRGRTEAKPEGQVEDNPLFIGVLAGGHSQRDLGLVAGKHLAGRVVDSRGLPVEGATVDPVFLTVHGKIGFAACECAPYGVPLERVTGVDGRFALPAVWPAGNLTVKVSCPGYREDDVTLAIDEARGEMTLKIESASAFSGTVSDVHGHPVQGALVFAGAGDPATGGVFLMRIKQGVDESGRFSDPGTRSPKIVLAWAPGYGLAAADLSTCDASRLDLRLAVADGRIRGVVRDDAGLVVAGARVTAILVGVTFGSAAVCMPLNDNFTGAKGDLIAFPATGLPAPTATTAVDGGFELAGVPSGAGTFVTLRVEVPGSKPKVVRVPDGGSADVTLDTAAK